MSLNERQEFIEGKVFQNGIKKYRVKLRTIGSLFVFLGKSFLWKVVSKSCIFMRIGSIVKQRVNQDH